MELVVLQYLLTGWEGSPPLLACSLCWAAAETNLWTHHSPSPGRFQTLLWPPPCCTFPPRTPSPSVLASSPRRLDSPSCVCSETGSPLEGTVRLKKEGQKRAKRAKFSHLKKKRASECQTTLRLSNTLAQENNVRDVAKYLTLTVSTGNNRDVYHHQLQLKCQRGFSGLASRLACNCLLTAVGPADEQQD